MLRTISACAHYAGLVGSIEDRPGGSIDVQKELQHHRDNPRRTMASAAAERQLFKHLKSQFRVSLVSGPLTVKNSIGPVIRQTRKRHSS